MISEETILDTLLWIAVTAALILSFVSIAAFGRQLADLEYQRVAGLNGIRSIQSYTNLRNHSSRILLALVYLLTGILSIADVDPLWRIWVSRTLLIFLLVYFTFISIKDWFSERAQVRKILNDPASFKVSDVRLQVHDIKNSFQIIVYLATAQIKSPEEAAELTAAIDDLSAKLDKIQNDVRSLDPNFRP